ncbi:hypothetical protein FA15DRAFT_667041 [Coprinopsis marcescibilis]|uniref:Uncharacterized protein n=1 Tax=Coprinopsis marcescibilis TaxID=230819 RepID=A0A5C3L2F9_COPMA|nr:hypothetical protein FA15DRAFT_667041 [Coprinopsis marcescibilis]
MASSLSSVVSNLVRAQMGSTLAPTVTDEDLDRHIAELILKEAKTKVERYNQQGIRALITSNNNLCVSPPLPSYPCYTCSPDADSTFGGNPTGTATLRSRTSGS